MTYKEQLRKIWRQYEQENQKPATAREAVVWAVGQNLIKPPPIDPLDKMSDDMASALREEYAIDDHGRRYRVNHAIRVCRGGVQLTFWAIITDAPAEHMRVAFQQRREQIVDDCVQLATDIDAYNGMHPDQPVIPMLFDFTDDIQRRRG